MTDDLVARLRAVDHMSVEDCFLQSSLFAHAADRLEAAEARVRELEEELAQLRVVANYNREQAEKAERALAEARKALEPFAQIADVEDEVGREYEDDRVWVVQAYGCQIGDLTVEDFRAARRAYEGVNADG